MRDIRGRDIAMVFQDPMSSLNPVVTIGKQVAEVLERHRGMAKEQARAEAAGLLAQVGIPDPDRRLSEYPHQLSGGMRQRALIAMALACRPRLLIADEPTTALDVTIQAQILELLKQLVADAGTALIMITHDLGVVAGLCDRVHVMYSGRIVEAADRHPLFAEPRHPYTGGLLASIPRLDSAARRAAHADPWLADRHAAVGARLRVRPALPERPGRLPRVGARRWNRADQGGRDAALLPPARACRPPAAAVVDMTEPLLEVRGLEVHFPIRSGLLVDRVVGQVKAVDGVDLAVERGTTFGLVGESGCGKSTLGEGILRLVEPTAGQVVVRRGRRGDARGRGPAPRPAPHADDLPGPDVEPEPPAERRVDPDRAAASRTAPRAAPRRTRPGSASCSSWSGCRRNAASRYPHEFSGGQRQRIGIARAIALNPELIIADEPVSALDVSIQAQVINLLEELQDALGLTYVVIAHDLAVVRHISDVIGVMYLGAIVEQAPADDLYREPLHPYTKALMSAVPIPDPLVEDSRERILIPGDLPSPANPPHGCRFHTRCPFRQESRVRRRAAAAADHPRRSPGRLPLGRGDRERPDHAQRVRPRPERGGARGGR